MIDRNLSFSQIKSWHECRRQWAYKYRDGYRLNHQRFDFMRGTMLHLGMENTVCVEDRLVDIGWDIAVEAWNDEYETGKHDLMMPPGWFDECKSIVLGAREVFRRDWEVVWEEEDGPLIERRMYAKLPDFYRGIVFIPDAVCVKREDPYAGGVFAVDFKSFGKPKREDAGLYDLQGAIYQRGLREKGYPAIGTVLFQLAAEGRKPIRIRKDGEPYAGDQERYDNWKPVNGQILTVRSEEFLDGVWDQIVLPTAMEMHDAELAGSDLTLIPKLDYYACTYCDFRDACQARLKGHDEAEILAENYSRRTSRPKGEPNAENV